jgi:hypothetical protein
LGFFGFFGFFSFFRVFFGLFRNSLFRLFRLYTETESFDVAIEPKQTEDPPKQIKREYIWVFFRKFRVVSVCFGLLLNRSVCFGCFDIGSKHRNKLKYFVFGFTKQTETNEKQILFRFVSVRTKIFIFCEDFEAASTGIASPPLLALDPGLAFGTGCYSGWVQLSWDSVLSGMEQAFHF